MLPDNRASSRSASPRAAVALVGVLARLAAAAAAALAGCALSPSAPTLEQRTAALAGTIAFEDGRPAAAVRVRLWLPGGMQEAGTDGQGRFEMTLLEAGPGRLAYCGGGAEPGVEPLLLKAGKRAALSLAVKPARRDALACAAYFAAAASGAPGPDWSQARWRVPLQPVRPVKAALPGKDAPAALRGSVLDARGAPAVAALVQLRRAGEERVAAELAVGPDGRFELKQLVPGRYDLEVAGDGAALVQRGLWLGPGRTRELGLNFGRRRGQVIVSGRVTGADGAPIAGARVVADSRVFDGRSQGPNAAIGTSPSASEAAHSRADGRFALAIPEAAPSGLFAASKDGALAGAVLDLPVGSEDLAGELVLRPLAPQVTCSGRVTFPDGSPASGATVRATRTGTEEGSTGTNSFAAAVTGADGAWRLSCPSGAAMVRATLGAAVARAEAAVPCSGLELRLAPAAVLRVRVTFREPVQRLVAQVLPLEDELPFLEEPRRRAESDGEPFEIDGLPIGTPIDLSVISDDGRAVQGSVVLPGASIWEVELPLDEPRK